MDKEYQKLMRELMEIGFSIYDLALYLDTHPGDERALRIYNSLVKKNKELEAKYQCKYGPLRIGDMSQYPWQYIETPWPWEVEYCGCDK